MSKTPRTEKMSNSAFGDDGNGDDYVAYVKARNICKQIETELSDLKAQFAEYVKSEKNWRKIKRAENIRDAQREADKLRERAEQTLGL